MNDIQQIFNHVLEYSQNLEEINTSMLFEQWASNKQFFIQAFGGLTYTSPEKIKLTLTQETKDAMFKDFCTYLSIENPNLGTYVETQKDGFFKNVVVQETEGIQVNRKLVKSFKMFEKDPVKLRHYQDCASRIIQSDLVEGHLTISVHPLDFLSLSENAHGWTSCHSLSDDYRAGNLSYMIDDCTAICYLSSGIPEEISNFPEDIKWNSKKWRMLIHISKDGNMIFANKQYPFFKEEMLDEVYTKLLPKLGVSSDKWCSWQNQYISQIPFDDFSVHLNQMIPVGNQLVCLESLFSDGGKLFFNDLLHSSTYINPYYIFKCYKHTNDIDNTIWAKLGSSISKTRFGMGENIPKCLRCNKKDIIYSEMVYCLDCCRDYGHPEEYTDIFGECCNCGEIFLLDELEVVNDDFNYKICKECCDDLDFYRCDCCFNLYTEDEIFIDRFNHECICEWCRQDREDLNNGSRQ